MDKSIYVENHSFYNAFVLKIHLIIIKFLK